MHLENLVCGAESELFLVSPYLQISRHLYERLASLDANVTTTIIYGKSDLNRQEENMLYELDNLQMYYVDNLHAKCYFNEQSMIITSMNLYEYSEKNNREMGVLLDSVKDKLAYDAAVEETMSMLKVAEERKRRKNGPRRINIISLDQYGFCIRTGKKIPFNPEKPFTAYAYKNWAPWGNPDYEERYCHMTGEESFGQTSYNRPILLKNYRELKRMGVFN
ncbi:MAG: phospholipase D family protein [Cyclobacteriaceae bacterium]